MAAIKNEKDRLKEENRKSEKEINDLTNSTEQLKSQMKQIEQNTKGSKIKTFDSN